VAGKTYIIEYQTHNSARQVGIVNFAKDRAQALEVFTDANGFNAKIDPLQPLARLRNRTGKLYAIEFKSGPLFFCKITDQKTRDYTHLPVLIVGRTRGLEGLNGFTETIMPLPASTDLVPKPIVCGPLYEKPEAEISPPAPAHDHGHCPQCGADERSKQWRFVTAPGGGLWACDCGAMWRDWDKATKEQTPPFETIIDEHDGRVDLRATITMPNGFMVEVAIENVDGTPDVALYAGMPDDPNGPIPGELIGRWDVARLLG